MGFREQKLYTHIQSKKFIFRVDSIPVYLTFLQTQLITLKTWLISQLCLNLVCVECLVMGSIIHFFFLLVQYNLIGIFFVFIFLSNIFSMLYSFLESIYVKKSSKLSHDFSIVVFFCTTCGCLCLVSCDTLLPSLYPQILGTTSSLSC